MDHYFFDLVSMRDKQEQKLQQLKRSKADLEGAIDAHIDSYQKELEELKSRYAPTITSMIQDYRKLERAIACASCDQFLLCPVAVTFENYSS